MTGKDMKVIAEKLPDGKFELFLEIPRIKLPVRYGPEDLEILERNGVLNNRDSYNAGTLLKFTLPRDEQERIVAGILDAVTEGG